MTYHPDYYQIPTAIDSNIAQHLIKTVRHFGSDSTKSLVGGNGMLGDGSMAEGILNRELRNSSHRWIPTDNWVAGMMSHFIREANRNFFKYDLTGWSDQIQYTDYHGAGKHYDWHADSAESSIVPGTVRKLSISLLLSDPDQYEGGEFQLMFPGNKGMKSFKPALGQAIIFPSYAAHRVRPLRSGRRISLVGWYGGPQFR